MLMVPDEVDLLTFFESEPAEAVPEDGYYCYKCTDDRGIELYFSFHRIERSIQVRLMLSGVEMAVISEEFADRVTIENDKRGEYLVCYFKLGQVESRAEIHLVPSIMVRWYTLQT